MYENDFCEYAVTKKKEGAYLAKIVVFAAALIFAVILAFVFVIPMAGAVGFLIIALCVALMWYLSRFTAIEYEYTLSGEYMDFAEIYSKQYRKEKLSVELKKCARRIMPYDGEISGFNISKVYDFRSSKAVPNAYVLVFEDDGGEKAVLFDANKRIVENMFRQTPSLVVRNSNLPE